MATADGAEMRNVAASIHEELQNIHLSTEASRSLAVIGQWARTSQPNGTPNDLLNALSDILTHPLCTSVVARHAGPLLVDLFARAVEKLHANSAAWTDWSANSTLYALSLLIAHHDELQPIVSQLVSLPTLDTLPLNVAEEQLCVTLMSTYRIITVAPTTFDDAHTLLNPAELHRLVTSPAHNSQLRLLALRILAQLQLFSEATMHDLIHKYIGEPSVSTAQSGEEKIRLRLPMDGVVVLAEEVDAWVLPLQEKVRESIQRHDLLIDLAPLRSSLRPGTALFGNRLFLRSATSSEQHSTFKETPSLQPVLQSFAAQLRNRLPILVSGPEACGKTSLISHACSQVASDTSSARIVWLQLGDQSGIDAKALVGSFVSSSKQPGTFEWTEGALTRAVRLGKWVVLEDIDKANNEILSVVKPLVEAMAATKTIGARPYLDLGHRGHVRAGRGFALFATRTVSNAQQRQKATSASLPAATFFGHQHWSEVQMGSLQREDVIDIVTSNHALLALAQDGAVERLVSTWHHLVDLASKSHRSALAASTQVAAGTLRVPSLHDLLKWCRRVDTLIAKSGSSSSLLAKTPFANQSLQEEIALEASDIFLGASPPPATADDPNDRFSLMLRSIATELNVDPLTLWHSVRERKPELSVQAGDTDGKLIRIGRCSLVRPRHAPVQAARFSSTFALTGPTARLLERISVCVSLNEPSLIVGETGTGKTTVVQQLAAMMRKPLVALNLSQQTESADLLGGFKPLDPKLPAMELHNAWLDLFQRTFSLRRNARYVQGERKALQAQKWKRLHDTWCDSVKLAMKKLHTERHDTDDETDEPARKAMRTTQVGGKQDTSNGNAAMDDADQASLLAEWHEFEQRLVRFGSQHTGRSKRALVFSFVEGPLVKAIREGSWVLLDEVNLATSETLECLSTLLQSPQSSIVLSERGDLEPVARHPDFRLFACMNPATDVGKKDLPSSLRSRFTEFYAPSPDSDQEALVSIVESYIAAESAGDRGAVLDAAQCYVQIKQLSRDQKLADGANQRPHYSIRSLARALVFAKDTCAVYGLRRALYEGFVMAFTMLLDNESRKLVRALLERNIMSRAKNAKAAASFVPPKPTSGAPHVQVGSFWLETGSELVDDVPSYILTTSVQDKLVGLARAALTRRSPVLIQGPTSAGKTSAVEYLAKRTGHRFVRINNHEHTDLQEYLGSYTTDSQTGQLAFHEGLLVTAARRGDWIVLDELNLAPTDVLEALNRLLDDNRELVIPETGEVVKPHPHFMLFATQNPPGLYAGRKVLSRAFRNRFLEIHFDDVPQAELQTILARRCQIPPSYADKIVRVFLELQRHRQSARVFDTKQAFVTLRDLFRWGSRPADDYQRLAHNGYMLIAERTRKQEDGVVVKDVIEETMKVTIDTSKLYDVFDAGAMSALFGDEIARALTQAVQGTGIVWTHAMRRLVCLVASALCSKEPVLLVGETGSGKTSVCQVLSNVFGRPLTTVNCHQNTDAADLLGGQRPIRNRLALKEAARVNGIDVLREYGDGQTQAMDALDDVAAALAGVTIHDDASRQRVNEARVQINQSLALFQWHDGPLVDAMRSGQHMLLDEISLADDSVLERLNSVLEPERTLVLAERGGAASTSSLIIKADEEFQIVATMNPGGDYGKKELSPALRNRFTEIWVPAVHLRDDVEAIVDSHWTDKEILRGWSSKMVDFVDAYSKFLGGADSSNVGLRDLISWACFIDTVVVNDHLAVPLAFVHGAMMTFIDGLPLHPWIAAKPQRQIAAMTQELIGIVAQLGELDDNTLQQLLHAKMEIDDTQRTLSIGGFGCAKGIEAAREYALSFNLSADTPAHNAMRVLRALQVPQRAIMLEGSPGAGKTSLIVALAHATQHRLTRINLSDQTELSDLFGSDLPVEGGKPGEFGWRDAAFLQAMQQGDWVLLDEMNLASQSVLEGLNSCLDHRGTVYVPELGKEFSKHPSFRFFAAQNPQHQGGGRKGLPKSFLNRFTKVHVEELREADFRSIMGAMYSSFPPDQLDNVITFNERLQVLLRDTMAFSKLGQPWEFNLRDLLRWLDMAYRDLGFVTAERRATALEYLASLYILRFRTAEDRQQVVELANDVFGTALSLDRRPWLCITPRHVQIGHVLLSRDGGGADKTLRDFNATHGIAHCHLPVAQALGECVRLGWPAIVVGKSGAGKSSLVRKMSQLCGTKLHEVRLNGGTDAVDIIGGFEQEDARGEVCDLLQSLYELVEHSATTTLANGQDQHHYGQALDLCAALRAELERIGSDDQYALPWSALLRIGEQSLALAAPQDHPRAASLVEQLQTLSLQPSDGASGRFAWRDGPVVSAMRSGEWLLLDDANMCSASVLDRLNSVLEKGGSLVLSERGVVNSKRAGELAAVETITPHANFRIFFTMDPKHGELSRAMRNRGMELYLDDWHDGEVQQAASSLSVHEASLGSVAQWAGMVKAPNALVDLQAQAAMACVVAGTSTEDLALVARLLGELKPDIMATVHSQSVELQDSSKGIKLAIAEGSNIDHDFLQQLGPDVQQNPNLWTSDSAAEQSIYSSLVHLYVRMTCAFKSLADFSRTLDVKQLGTATVLQRSAMHAAGHDIDRLPQEDRLCFALVQQVTLSIGEKILSEMTAGRRFTTEEVDVLDLLADCGAFLTQLWDSAHRNDNSVSRVIFATMSAQLARLGVGVGLARVAKLLQDSAQHVQLRSGYAMAQLWRAFLPQAASAESYALSRVIQTALKRVMHDAPSDLISNAVEIAALLAHSPEASSAEQRAELVTIGQRVLSALDALTATEAPLRPFHVSDDLLACFVALSAQQQQHVDQRHASSAARLMETSNASAALLSSAVKLMAPSSGASRGTFDWVATIPSASVFASCDRAASTQDIFRPSVLRAVMDACIPVGRVSLVGMEHRRCALTRMSDVVSRLGVAELPSRAEQCATMLHSLVASLRPFVCSALADSDDDGEQEDDGKMRNLVDSATEDDLPAILNAVTSSNSASEKARAIASDWLQCLAATALQPDLRSLGAAFVTVARVLLRLYVPNIAVDPLVTSRTRGDLIAFQVKRLEAHKAILATVQAAVTGQTQSDAIVALDMRITQLHEQAKTADAVDMLGRQANTEQLHQLHGEMHAFATQMFSATIVDSLLNHTGARSAQLLDLQATIASFYHRLTTRYPDLDDLTAPFLTALLLAQLGLGMLQQAQSLSTRSSLTARVELLLDALISFPTSRATAAYMQQDVPVRLKQGTTMGGLVVPLLLAKVKAAVQDVRDGQSMQSTLGALTSCYDQVWHLWTLDQETAKQKRAEESSLYRMRNLDIKVEDDGVLQEREFAALFPQYKDVLDEAEEERSETTTTATKKATFVDDADVRQLFHLHLTLFGVGDLPHVSVAGFTFDDNLDSIASQLVRTQFDELNESLDKRSAAAQRRMISIALARGQGGQHGDTVDFYVDACPSEAIKLQTLVLGVQARLDALIADWPEQEVLKQLRQRCEVIVQLDVASPVNRMLAALEGLLMHTEDWQMYASSKTTLQPQRDDITAQIIAWRRMELHGWKRLLVKEEKAAFEKANEWWFTLFEVTIKAANDDADASVELVALLDKFVRGAQVGQFAGRLALLRSMHVYLSQMGRCVELSAGQERICSIVGAICAFFGQFEPTVAAHLAKKRALVDAEIAAFVKLASWKDTNVHALKASAQKTHRKLHQCLRKFRSALNEGTDALLANVGPMRQGKLAMNGGQVALASLPTHELSDTVAKRQAWHADLQSTPTHLVNLDVTAGTLHRMFSTTIGRDLTNDSVAAGLFELSTTIVEQSEALAKATPAFHSDDNEKLVKHLETRKRKAWSELLKELRRVGMSTTSVDGMASASLSDSGFVFALRGPEEHNDDASSTLARASRQYYTLLAMLPVLRGALGSQERNADVNVAQLQTAKGYVENGFMFACAHRLRLRHLTDARTWFNELRNRLGVLVADEGKPLRMLTGTIADIVASLTTHIDFLTRIVAGIRQTLVEAPRLASEGAKVAEACAVLSKAATEADASRAQLQGALDSVRSGGSSLITQTEAEALQQAQHTVDDVIAALQTAVHAAPALRCMTLPMLDFVRETRPAHMPHIVAEDELGDVDIGARSDQAISSVLVVAQNVRALCKANEAGKTDDLDDRAVLHEAKHVASYQRELRIDDIQAALTDALSPRKVFNGAEADVALQRLRPFVEVYCGCLDALIARSTASFAALMELTVTVCSLVTTLANRGFCRPKAPEQDKGATESKDGEQQDDGGVGLGDGEGAQDVTDTLKDDEEMEELQQQGEKEEEEERGETQREKNAREMEQDFDGEMGDVEDDDEGEQPDDGDEEQEEVDEAVGDVDPLDLNAVDEKTWAGQEEEEDDKKEQKEKDKSEKEQKGQQSEAAQDAQEGREDAQADEKDESGAEGAGQRNEKQQQKKPDTAEGEEGEEKQQQQQQPDGQEGDQEEEDEVGEQGQEDDENEDADEATADGLGRAIDQEAQQGENLELDLDEELNMDDNDGKDDVGGSDMGDMDGLSDAASEVDDSHALTPDAEGEQEKVEKIDGDPQDDDGDDVMDEDEKPDVGREGGEDAAEEEEDKDAAQAETQEAKQQSNDDGIQSAQDQGMLDGEAEADAAAAGDAEQDAPAQQQQSSRARSGRQTRGSAAQAKEESAMGEEEEDVATEPHAEDNAGAAGQERQQQGEAGQQGDEDAQQQQQQEQDNGPRSLGDALEKFRRDLRAIEERLTQNAERDGEGPSSAEQEADEVEHIANDDDSEMQALGVAKEDEAHHRANDLAAVQDDNEDAEEDDKVRPPLAEEDDIMMNARDEMQAEHDADAGAVPKTSRGLMASDIRRTDAERDADGELEQPGDDERMDDEDDEQLNHDIVESMEALSSEEDSEKRLELAQHLWKLYAASTTEFAFALSEQLRLILTPTKATKLTGDFKTGKRLNMRKIVPFIASDYVKDKIWLRRHEPQKREYQVLLCIDDSKSMSDSENRTLAFKSLALVCRALDRLEVGEVGVMKFGRRAELLKGFGESSTTVGDVQGAQILSRLPFDQRGTNVLQLLRTSYDVLVDARSAHSTGAHGGQLWQLQIIISDGVCQDHEGVRAMLRRAAEAHILVVFVILDSLQQRDGNSILTMSTAAYLPDANGRPQLQMKRYLDTFPFDFFVVVQDVADLPDVLSATLRQWAQRIAEM